MIILGFGAWFAISLIFMGTYMVLDDRNYFEENSFISDMGPLVCFGWPLILPIGLIIYTIFGMAWLGGRPAAFYLRRRDEQANRVSSSLPKMKVVK